MNIDVISDVNVIHWMGYTLITGWDIDISLDGIYIYHLMGYTYIT